MYEQKNNYKHFVEKNTEKKSSAKRPTTETYSQIISVTHHVHYVSSILSKQFVPYGLGIRDADIVDYCLEKCGLCVYNSLKCFCIDGMMNRMYFLFKTLIFFIVLALFLCRIASA